MSEPVSNAAIEDVLSSIRRLVSENARAPKAPGIDIARSGEEAEEVAFEGESADEVQESGEPEANGTVAKIEEALVLTPSFRVAESEPEEVDESVEAAESDEAPVFRHHDRDAESSEETVQEADWSEPEIEAHGADDEWDELDDSGGDYDPEQDPDIDEPDMGDIDEAPFREVTEAEAQAEAEEPFEPAIEFETLRNERLYSRLRDWQGDEPQNETLEPDAPGDNDYAGSAVDSMDWQPDEADEPDTPEIHEEVAPESDLADLAGRIEEEAAAYSVDAVVVEVSDGIGATGTDDMVVDEDMLRDLVAEIVRQELQGALGERITRNVRKLVRREIHRALAMQDLD